MNLYFSYAFYLPDPDPGGISFCGSVRIRIRNTVFQGTEGKETALPYDIHQLGQLVGQMLQGVHVTNIILNIREYD